MSITDHDSIDAQERAIALANEYGIAYITGVELNVTFQYLGKSIALDFLGYQYDIDSPALKNKLQLMREHREARARQILDKLNAGFMIIECTLDEQGIKQRLAQRLEQGSASDGRWERFEPIVEVSPQEHVIIDTSQPVGQIISRF